MTETKLLTIAELSAHVDGHLLGDGSIHVERVAELDSAGAGDIAYVDGEKFFEAALSSGASCLIVPPEFVLAFKEPIVEREIGPALIEVAKPKLAFVLIAELLHPQKRRDPYIHTTAVIAETADIDLTVYIGPHVCIGEHTRIAAGTRLEAGVVIGDHVRVGLDCVLHPGTVLYDDVTIGDRVILHAGVCIGADGFGYVRDDMGYHKFPQRGTVVSKTTSSWARKPASTARLWDKRASGAARSWTTWSTSATTATLANAW